MPSLQFSIRALQDLAGIDAYTLEEWGETQADRYLGRLQACFTMLLENSRLGRDCGRIRSDLRRMEHGKHVVFYRLVDGGIRVSRILHQSMSPRPDHFAGNAE
jgi:toxin ParE1/3/4